MMDFRRKIVECSDEEFQKRYAEVVPEKWSRRKWYVPECEGFDIILYNMKTSGYILSKSVEICVAGRKRFAVLQFGKKKYIVVAWNTDEKLKIVHFFNIGKWLKYEILVDMYAVDKEMRKYVQMADDLRSLEQVSNICVNKKRYKRDVSKFVKRLQMQSLKSRRTLLYI